MTTTKHRSISAGVKNTMAWPMRVYYEDTDSGGVVYHANYLKFMERARTEWLTSLGFEQDALIRDHNILFAVRSISVEYLRAARFNQRLETTVTPIEASRASLTFEQQVRLMSDPQASTGDSYDPTQVLCTGRVKIACLDAATLRPRRMPACIYEEIASVS